MKSVAYILATLVAVAGVASIASGCAVQSGDPHEATGETSEAMCKTSPCGVPTCYPGTTISCRTLAGSGYGVGILGKLPEAANAQWMTPESPFESQVQALLGVSEPGGMMESWTSDGGVYEAVGVVISASEASNASLISAVDGPGQQSSTEDGGTTVQIHAGILQCTSTTVGLYDSTMNDCGGKSTVTSYIVDWDPHSVNN